MVQILWKRVVPYSKISSLITVPRVAGIYVIFEIIGDKQYVRYVGQAANLHDRLEQHRGFLETNRKILNAVSFKNLGILFSAVPNQTDRNGIELFLYNKFHPDWNEIAPPGQTEIPVVI